VIELNNARRPASCDGVRAVRSRAVEAQAVWSITLVGRVLAAEVSRNPEPVVGTEVLEQAPAMTS
jgi:hypothetical protein